MVLDNLGIGGTNYVYGSGRFDWNLNLLASKARLASGLGLLERPLSILG